MIVIRMRAYLFATPSLFTGVHSANYAVKVVSNRLRNPQSFKVRSERDRFIPK
jgi:hypothetical protein